MVVKKYTKPKFYDRRAEILDIVSKLESPTIAEIMPLISDDLKTTRVTLGKDLAICVEEGFLEPAGYTRYRLTSKGASVLNESRPSHSKLASAKRGALKPSDFEGMLNLWARQKWTPKVVEQLPLVPMVVAKFYKIVYKLSEGQVVDQGPVDDMKVALSELYSKVVTLKSTIENMLSTPDVWDVDLIGAFLLETDTDTETLLKLATQLEKENFGG